LFDAIVRETTTLDLRILGRTLLHAALVGAGAGVFGAAFFAVLEYVGRFLLEDLAGYVPLRARGEEFLPAAEGGGFVPWLLVLLPGAGALLGGWFTRFAPEARGGGGDAMIRAFHLRGGRIRPRVIGVRAIASILTLGSGGAGGREGPTMQIGGAIGSWIGDVLRVGPRERRLLMVAGVAAGMSAVFRTPLGAALLAIEVLYRDDFESDALVPSVLASVVAYAIVISIFGESTLLERADRYEFHPRQLVLYAALALAISLAALLFLSTLDGVRQLVRRFAVPAWARPGIGGLGLGMLAVPMILWAGERVGVEGQGLGILGGGYGSVQMAIAGSDLLPAGWARVEILLGLCLAKLVAASLTIGSGGSAGDFAPSLVIGGLLGGAFGSAARLLLDDPTIDPGAFALVGMATFYGGIAHVPIASLILVSELAGSYDLLVPLMLAGGIAFVTLRRRSLYPTQVTSKREIDPAPPARPPDPLSSRRAGDLVAGRELRCLRLGSGEPGLAGRPSGSGALEAQAVVDDEGKLVGMVIAAPSAGPGGEGDALAERMRPPVSVREDATVREAARLLLSHRLRAIAVVDASGRLLGMLDEGDVVACLAAAGTDASRDV
jgi:CIC family chloride channel protein